MTDKRKPRDELKKTRENKILAQELTDKINTIAIQAAAKEKDIEIKLISIQKHFEKSSEAKNKVVEITKIIGKSFIDFNTAKNQIDSLLSEISKFNTEQFNPISQKFLNKETGVNVLINEAKGHNKTIKDLENQANKHFLKLDKQVLLFQNKLDDINNVETAITELHKKAQDPEEGLQAKLKQVTGIKDQILTVYNETKESHKISNELKNEIEKFREDSSHDMESIHEFKENSDSFSAKIKELYDISQLNLTGGVIDKTRKEFIMNQWIWLGALVAAIGITSYIAYLLTPESSQITDSNYLVLSLFLRYAILFPLIFLIIFCGKQYKISRVSAEKYTFKTVLSVSLEGKIYYLMDRFKRAEDREKILEFSLMNFKKLYDEPFYDEAMKMKYNIEQDKIRFGKQEEDLTENSEEEIFEESESDSDSVKPEKEESK